MNRGELNKQAALSNIILKKEILQSWGGRFLDGDLHRNEYYPKTIRQFNSWDLSQNSEAVRLSLPPISRNANETLNNYPATRAEIVVAMSLLSKQNQVVKDVKPRVQRLMDEIKSQNKYIQALELELVTLRVEYSDWAQRETALRERYDVLLKEFKASQVESENKLAFAMAENSKLVAALSKVSVLRGIQNE